MNVLEKTSTTGAKLRGWASSKVAGVVAVAAAAAAPAISHAQSTSIDVSALVAEISGTKDPVMQVGMAVLGVLVAIACFVFIRKAMRGG